MIQENRERDNTICTLYKNGKTFQEVARIAKTSTKTIQIVLSNNNIKSRPVGGRRIKHSKDAVLFALNKFDGSVSKAAKYLSVCTWTVYNYIRRYELQKITTWR